MEQTVKTVLKIGSALILSGLAAANISNAAVLSAEEFKQYASEEAYWVVEVDCEDGSKPRTIQRKTDGTQWCGKEIDGFCSSTKNEAAEKVCGSEYSATVNNKAEAQAEQQRRAQAQRQATEQAARDQREAEARATAAREQAAEAKRQSQIKIDEQLLQIEQEKLSLRRQELELQRRAVEIRESLDELESASQ